jgi:hypothetical protein
LIPSSPRKLAGDDESKTSPLCHLPAFHQEGKAGPPFSLLAESTGGNSIDQPWHGGKGKKCPGLFVISNLWYKKIN